MKSMKTTIVWFRKDLRIHDNPAFFQAASKGSVIPIFIWSEVEESQMRQGSASRWWLHQSLVVLQQRLASKGIPLLIRKGKAIQVLEEIIEETSADGLYYNERYEPSIAERDRGISTSLRTKEFEVRTFNAHLLLDTDQLMTIQKTPYKVYTSFQKRFLRERIPLSLPAPDRVQGVDQSLFTLTVEELGLLPNTSWNSKLHDYWKPGEIEAIGRWNLFVNDDLERYGEGKDFPALPDVSKLSPHIAFGEISIRGIWHSLQRQIEQSKEHRMDKSIDAFLKQLIWREFAYHQLVHFPEITSKPLRSNFEKFPWLGTSEEKHRWEMGMTGYPFVDAGMRELRETGWMHNRMRMVVASFLIKHLLISWTDGYAWFSQTLVDFDCANNAMGWQWSAGSGIDSAPYFRIFNPILQSERFDSEGEYIRKWIPELDRLPTKYIHSPWTAPTTILENAGIELGHTYPFPMIDHTSARNRALAAYSSIKGK